MDNTNLKELARKARRALEQEREYLTEMAQKVEGYDCLLDSYNNLISENEDLREQLQQKETQLNEINKFVAGVAKKSPQDEVLKAIRVFVNKSKQKTSKKRTLIKEMVLEFTFANGIALPEELAATVSALDDEQNEPVQQVIIGTLNGTATGAVTQMIEEKRLAIRE